MPVIKSFLHFSILFSISANSNHANTKQDLHNCESSVIKFLLIHSQFRGPFCKVRWCDEIVASPPPDAIPLIMFVALTSWKSPI